MKKYNKYLVFLTVFFIIYLFEITNKVNASSKYDGWYKDTKPKYTYSGSNIFNKNDINGSDIIKKVKTSYTYKEIMPKIKDSIYVQKLMYDVQNSGRYWSNYTYSKETPDESIGYTEWYDSPNGLVLDYLSKYTGGNTIPESSFEIVSYDIKKDIIDWNNIQYKNPNRAYIATTASEAKLADAKSASALSRADSSRNYPIYLNDGKDIDSDIKYELEKKNIRDLYIMGGSARFNVTAGLREGFNIIRAGGLNTQKTYEYMVNLPLEMNDPKHYKSDSEGIVIYGDLGDKFQSVYEELKILKSSRDINVLISLADKLSGEINVGKEPSKLDKPSLVLGVNVYGFETYWIVYYSKIKESYVYQFILPGYYEKYQPITEALSINGSNYHRDYNDYWFKTDSEINITTNAYMASTSDSYPDTMTLLLNSSEYNVKVDEAIVNEEFKDNFNLIGNSKAVKSKLNNRNYLTATHRFSAKNDDTSYSLKFTTKLYDYVAPIIDTEKTIKIDGKAPEINVNSIEEWTNKDVDINISSSDGKGSGVEKVELYDEKGKKIDYGLDSLWLYVEDEGVKNYILKAYDYVGNVSKKDIEIKIDKTAPTGKVDYDYNENTSELDISVGNIIEKGSGVEKIWVEFYPEYEEDRKITQELVKTNNSYKGKRDLFELFPDSIDPVEVVIKSIDKVGNEGELFRGVFDPFKIEATITRDWKNYESVFKEGELGVVRVKLFGGIDFVEIEFPEELNKLAEESEEYSVLDTYRYITPQKKDSFDYKFYVPISAEHIIYTVKVIGHKNGKQKIVYPTMEVQGNILNKVRTRIR